MDLDCESEVMKAEEEMKTTGTSGSNHNHYSKNKGEQRRMVDITRDKPIKVAVRVVVPVRDHPKFNFVGKLLGPKGNSLKRLQEDTMCKMAVLGRGSMKDRHKEEELRASGDPKFQHLSEELHVEISAFATPAEAHARIAYALAEVRRFLVPTNIFPTAFKKKEQYIGNGSCGLTSVHVAAKTQLNTLDTPHKLDTIHHYNVAAGNFVGVCRSKQWFFEFECNATCHRHV
nr:KH domain-containing, RNA-binding, signal transduction-associated protein 2-like [Onthophagus taurus]